MEIKRGTENHSEAEDGLESAASGLAEQVRPGAAPATRPARMLSYKPVGALLAGLSVLRYIASAPGPMPLTQITKDLKLNPSTCLNILRTLTQEGYLIIDAHSKLYSMGLGVLELIGGALAQGADFRAIRQVTDAIAVSEGVTVTLWRRVSPERKLLVLESLPVGEMKIKMEVGQRLPLLVGAAGYLWAAHSRLSDDELSEQFSRIRLERRPSFGQFMEEARAAKLRGWALDDGGYTAGATSIAVPVLDKQGDAVFAFTATMFSIRFDPDRAQLIADELQRPAKLLASVLPYL